MGMKAVFKKDGDIMTVSIQGKLDYESHEILKENLNKIINHQKTDSVPKKIIFDMGKLEFVGSSGITSLIQTLKEFHSKSPSHHTYQNVRNEFQKIIKAYDADNMFEFEDNNFSTKKPMDN
ncbi:MAG: STAS domain-containing protein [Bdellovibrio sp.]|nr:STAS domain-containing protein [Bdellovibrio sp.]